MFWRCVCGLNLPFERSLQRPGLLGCKADAWERMLNYPSAEQPVGFESYAVGIGAAAAVRSWTRYATISAAGKKTKLKRK